MKIERHMGFYEKYVKRALDIACSLLAIVCLWWLYVVIGILVRVKMGSPVIFKQPRPGRIDVRTGQEWIFNMYKFRTMTDERDENGNLLPDEQRLGSFGKWLRSTSLDELPEVFNILLGDMSIIGPRPQLVRDMVFMSEEVRQRHTARPGLSGLAQVEGRNAITWDEKFEWDLEYIENVSFLGDLKILWKTVMKVFGRSESSEELDVTLDYGDWLLLNNRISQEEYVNLQDKAKEILSEHERKN